ncbi:MAG TPA: ABC transporter permease [Bryobacteraceae bacterium]|nr:ABC transporter permease [Bryobacteraceae bacterium]
MHLALQDLKYALRTLRKSPGLTLVIVLSLAIGIGANSAVFSVVDALLLRPLPYPQPDRLAAIWLHSPGIGIFRDWPSPGQYIDIRTQNHSFSEMSISRLTTVTLSGRDQPERVDGMRTSSSLFHLLGARPLFGRLLLPEEDQPGRPPVAVLSYRVWQRLFNSDRGIVGRSITLNSKAYTVVGVLRPDFLLNSEVMPAEGPMDKIDIFVPLPLGPDAVNQRGDENYNLMARLKPGVTVRQAQADIDIIAGRIRVKDKRDRTFGMTVIGLLDQVVGDVRRAMLVLLGSVGLVLLSACANVANLLLTRAAGREKEVAIRTALGAGWQRLVRQLLSESLLLSVLGGAAGLLIAEASLYLMRVINPGNVPRLEEIAINGPVLLFTFAISTAAGLLFGLAPAWRAIKLDLNTSLKSGGRSGQTDGGLLVSRHRLRGLLVVAELAFSLMLLVGAGLLLRSFVRLQSVPPGFAPDHVISLATVVTGPKYRDDKVVAQFYHDLGERIAHLPGVTSQGQVSVLPLTGMVSWGGINVEGFTPAPGQELQVDRRVASTDYFRAMKIPLLKGRYFDEHDTADSQQVVIVDEPFAARFWPHENPIGRHVWFDPKKPFTIAGVVAMVKQYGLDTGSKLVVYFPHALFPDNAMFVVARTAGDPAALARPIVSQIHALEPAAPVFEIRTMQDRLFDSLARRRFAMAMLGTFAAFALLLAAVGAYGVMSYLVTQSTHDIGVRMALGARSAHIMGLIVRQGMTLAAIGIGAGAIGAVALTRVMTSLLFGVSPTDVLTFGAVIAILAAVVFAATAIPARRATSVDPMVALREE